MKNQTILLTGATGFVGSHLLNYLVEKKYKVVILKRSTSDISRIKKHIRHISAYDIDKQKIEVAFQNHEIDVVMHLASSYGKNQNYENLIQSNVTFGLDLIALSIRYEIEVFMNTDSFFNHPGTVQSYLADYTTTKKHFLDWLYLRKDSIKIANMKLHHVYGESDSPDKFTMWLLRELGSGNKAIELTSGIQLRDFIYVQDVARAYEAVMLKKQSFDTMQEFNISTGYKYTVKEFCSLMGYKILKNKRSTQKVLLFGAKPDNPDEIMDVYNDNKALLNLGWKPEFDLESGLDNMIANTKG
ncbi:NAD(P)-dependent oxidoreductase [Pseudomonadales bacterium]|nr:NAD(P)-dependent oxidoreductase [Pseudomonadales bacterium]